MNEIICGACGTMAQDWQSFCTECGVSIEKQSQVNLKPIPVIGKQQAATISLLRMATFK